MIWPAITPRYLSDNLIQHAHHKCKVITFKRDFVQTAMTFSIKSGANKERCPSHVDQPSDNIYLDVTYRHLSQ